jgi:hypothetical protein
MSDPSVPAGPPHPTVLYHYCPTERFLSIVETQELRLSSLSLSNDTLEGRIAESVMATLAKRDGLSGDMWERLKIYLQFDQLLDGLGFCLSEDGDALSQWRGYAKDGNGFAIGFSRDYLVWLATKSREHPSGWGFSLEQVKYSSKEQEAELEPIYREAKRLIDQGALRYSGPRGLLDSRSPEQIAEDDRELQHLRSQLSMHTASLFLKLFTLKSWAFREEKEWRLLSYVRISMDDPVSYRPLEDRLVAYRPYTLESLDRRPILEVLLGPKQLTPPHMINALLQQKGFRDVQVKRSAASYR